MKTKTVLAVLVLIFLSGITYSQEKIRVTGIVTSFKTIPLRNVSILSSKTGDTATTDSAGVFSIQCTKKDVLRVSASGFISRKQKIKGVSVYKIDLVYRDDASNFNEAVNNGHIAESVLRDAITTGEAARVKDFSKYKSVYEAIAGEIYNVRVNGNMIVNTKLKSFDRTPEVLLVVDDKIVSDISYIDTEYIQSIEFIDDVGTALYGSMGANGVLKIKLK
ncbi:MAG: TonB-dependent receptor plug domain-containing protein [Bacteroidales bacterium]|jgi:hypothetical protein|nr:TonB-dependent receptor plug domain-containing protein [Bacteroidales bacterium]